MCEIHVLPRTAATDDTILVVGIPRARIRVGCGRGPEEWLFLTEPGRRIRTGAFKRLPPCPRWARGGTPEADRAADAGSMPLRSPTPVCEEVWARRSGEGFGCGFGA